MKAAESVAAPQPVTHSVEVPPVVAARWPWLKFVTPILVLVLAIALVITLTWNWNSWEGGQGEQGTDDAFIRGDLTPLSTKISGIVRDVKVADYQHVHKGDLLFDKKHPTAIAETFVSMLEQMKAVPTYLSELDHYLLDYPKAPSDAIQSQFYWEKVNFGLKPTLRIVQVILFRAVPPSDKPA